MSIYFMRANQKFFHTLDKDGHIDKQGEILSSSQSRVTVEFFSWLDGMPNGQHTFDLADTNGWRFYDSESEWRNAGDRMFTRLLAQPNTLSYAQNKQQA